MTAPTFVVARCDSCPAEIIWAVSAARGVPQPINAEPEVGGNIELIQRGAGVAPLARVIKPALAWGRADLRKAHHATCPNAAAHRRKRVAP